MFKLLRFYAPYKRNIALAIGSNLLMSLFTVISIPVLQPFLQILFNDEQKVVPKPEGGFSLSNFEQYNSWFFSQLVQSQGREGALIWVCVVLVIVFFGKNLFRYLSMFFLAPVRMGVVRDIRKQLVDKILSLPLSWITESRKGDLMSRTMTDVMEVEWSILGVVESVAREPIVILGSLTFMLIVSPPLVLFVLVLMVFSGLIIGGVSRSLKKQSGEAQTRLGTIGSLIEETLGGLRIIKGFNAEGYQRKRFAEENNAWMDTLVRILRRRDMASPLSEFLGITVVSVLLWYGARQVFAQELAAETFLTFIYAFYNVLDPVKALSSAFYNIRKGMGAVERIEAVLDADVRIEEKKDAQDIKAFSDKIEFRNVSFRYANAERDALSGVSFTLERGKIVALVGASGAGKSTIADLLPRFYDPQAGQILIDGIDIRELRLADLRAQLGIVSQEAVLFNDTVRNNITFGNTEATDEAVEAAARAANAHDFISAMPEGYDSNIGDRGTKLSGGQRQRLTIARALLKNPPVLILDEATSALDSESEKLVQTALERLLHERTALIIAHRLSTVQHADEILVLDHGQIVERGSHEYLMHHGEFYRNLVELQAL
ncbi:MAG: ABC transporter ATP-binding protein [Saprospiraceae bacterium]|nr:ABC transporter ATP-binding protein [Saprospiraceae bacterium]